MQNKRLSPMSLIINLKELVYLFFITFGITGFLSNKLSIILSIVASVMFIIGSTVSYFCFKYSLLEDQIVINKGWIFKKTIHVPYAKIQSIQHNQLFLLRPFDLEELKVENAAKNDNQSEVKFTAVPLAVGEFLEEQHRKFLSSENTNRDIDTKQNEMKDSRDNEPKGQILQYVIKPKDIALFTITSLRSLLLLFVADRMTSGRTTDLIVQFFGKLDNNIFEVIFTVLLLLFLSLILSYISLMIQYYDFTLTKDGKYIEFTKGIISKNKVRLSMDRIQSVVIDANIMKRIFKLATVSIRLASDDNDDNKKPIIMPIIKVNELSTMLNDFFPWLPVNQATKKLPRKRGLWIVCRNGLILPIIIMGASFNIFYREFIIEWIVLGVLVIVLSLINSAFKYRSTFVGITGNTKEDYLVIGNSRLFNSQKYYINWHNIQTMEIKHSIWMEKRNIDNIEVSIRSSNSIELLEAKYLDSKDAQKIYDWYCQ